jgi:hypothetical protein
MGHLRRDKRLKEAKMQAGAGQARRAGDLDGSQQAAWIGLRALAHPATLAAIAALLLNDHVLKRLTPGILTGKLSDFAGLLFFPMLIAVLLGWLVHWPRRRAATVGAASFAGSALLFALLKSVPQANAAARDLASSMLGLQIQLALDPSDLWALLVLPPALALWLRAESNPRPAPVRTGLLVTSLAALAVLATAPCPPEQPISRLVDGSDGVYAVAHAWDPMSGVYRSRDSGAAWEFLQEGEVPPEIAAQAEQSVAYPVVACAPDNPMLCYRIDGQQARVEESIDGAQTWREAWAPPASRLSYMRRVAAGSGEILACGKEIDFTPHDLILVRSGEDNLVLVGLGNEGVLRGRVGSADWERFGVGWAEATPERAASLQDLWPPSTILTETVLLLLEGALALLVLSVRAWTLSPRRPQASGEGYGWTWGVAAGVMVLAILGMLAASIEELLLMLGLPLALLLAYAAFLVQRWSIVLQDSLDPEAIRRSLYVSLAASFGGAALAWLPFALWIYGFVPVYSLAFVLALAVLMPGWIWGWRSVGGSPNRAHGTPAGGASDEAA